MLPNPTASECASSGPDNQENELGKAEVGVERQEPQTGRVVTSECLSGCVSQSPSDFPTYIAPGCFLILLFVRFLTNRETTLEKLRSTQKDRSLRWQKVTVLPLNVASPGAFL
jgi:hypothetical protein